MHEVSNERLVGRDVVDRDIRQIDRMKRHGDIDALIGELTNATRTGRSSFAPGPRALSGSCAIRAPSPHSWGSYHTRTTREFARG